MIKIILLTLILVPLTTLRAVEPLQKLKNISIRMNQIKNWSSNSSGRMNCDYDKTENALSFPVTFKPGTDFWIYPQFRLQPGESLIGAETIQFEFKADSPEVRYAYVMLSPGGNIPYSWKSNDWQTISVKLNNAKVDLKKVKYIRIGMNPKTENFHFQLKNITIIPAKEMVDTADAVECAAPGTVFTETQSPAFTLKRNSSDIIRFKITNFWGKCLKSGNWPDNGKGKLSLPPLPLGYYSITLNNDNLSFIGQKTFAIVMDPAKRKINPDSFFAIDTAQSWLARPNPRNKRFPQAGYELISELCRLAGFSMVRERLSWRGVESRKNHTFNWKQYTLNADLLSSRGIQICGMFHDAPQWTRYPAKQKRKTAQTNVPDDLLATYNFTKKLAETFKGKMTRWEFWNEQDHHNHNETPWDFAAASKAAYLGFKAGDPRLPVLSGSFCTYPLSYYCNLFFDNGGADYIDIFNYHIYQPLNQYSKCVSGLRTLLARFGLPSIPIYITENGTNAEGSGTVPSYMPGINAHTPHQNRIVAEFIPKSQILLQSLGIERGFFFVLPAYNERGGKKDWGLLRRDYSVKPGYVAYANLTSQLGSALFLGKYQTEDTTRGFLYEQPDHSQTLVAWSVSRVDTGGMPVTSDLLSRTIELKVQDKHYLVSDIFGKTFTLTASKGILKIPVTRYPVYINGLHNLKPSEPIRTITGFKHKTSQKDLTIVVKPYFEENFELSNTRCSVHMLKDTGKIRLEIFNLSPDNKSGFLTLKGVNSQDLPQKLSLSPMSKTICELSCSAAPQQQGKLRLEVSGTFNGKSISPLVVPIQSIADVKNAKAVSLDIAIPKRWRSNSSGKMTIKSDANENAICFDVEFAPDTDHWIYPEFPLILPKESLKGAIGMEFEIKANSSGNKPKIKVALAMMVQENIKEHGKAVFIPYTVPGLDWQKNVILFDEAVSPEKIKVLRIGMNPRSDKLSYSIRNLKVLYK